MPTNFFLCSFLPFFCIFQKIQPSWYQTTISNTKCGFHITLPSVSYLHISLALSHLSIYSLISILSRYDLRRAYCGRTEWIHFYGYVSIYLFIPLGATHDGPPAEGRDEVEPVFVPELHEAAQGHAHQPRRSGKKTYIIGQHKHYLSFYLSYCNSSLFFQHKRLFWTRYPFIYFSWKRRERGKKREKERKKGKS